MGGVSTWLLLVCTAGCGRIGFESSSTAGDDGGGPLIDAPPLPARLLCAADRIPLPPVPANSDLAIRASGATYAAMWAAPTEPVNVAIIDSGRTLTQPVFALPTGPVTGVAGMFQTATTTLFVATTTTGNELWSVPTQATAVMKKMDVRASAHDPIVSDSTGSLRAWVRSDASGIIVSYVDVDGNPSSDRTISESATVRQVSAADNSDHTHIAWAQDNGSTGLTDCFQSDMDLVPVAPMITSADPVAADCKNLRIDSGPDAADAIMTIWQSSTDDIRFRYHGSSVDLSGMLATGGRMPKVRFDGTRFWASWIGPGALLHIASIDEDATVETVDLPGFTVSSDEAFEIVRSETDVHLVLLNSDSLTFLRTCK